jgi:hypothetical protein
MKVYVGVIHNHEVYSSYPVYFGLNIDEINRRLKHIVETDRNYGCSIESEVFETDIDEKTLDAMFNLDELGLAVEIDAMFEVSRDNSYYDPDIDEEEDECGKIISVGRLLQRKDIPENAWTHHNVNNFAMFVGF